MSVYDPSTWRSRTAGGIPYRLLEGYPKFKFSAESASAEESYLILSSHLGVFAFESFPTPPQILNILGGGDTGRRYPGVSTFVTKEIDAEPFYQDKPGDPFLIDGGEETGTYSPLYRVNVHYETRNNEDDEEGDGTDPETFLTHSISAGGEYLCIPPDSVQSADEGEAPDDEEEGEVVELDPNGEPIEPPPESDATDVLKNNVPITKIIPTIEHNLDWAKCPNPGWGRLRSALGKLNSDRIPLFFNAPAGTVLFVGFSAKQEWEWFRNRPRFRPWTLSLKFSERALVERGRRMTWNHFWVPGKDHNRFEVLYLDPPTNSRKVYESTIFANIFLADNSRDVPEDPETPLSDGDLLDLAGDALLTASPVGGRRAFGKRS